MPKGNTKPNWHQIMNLSILSISVELHRIQKGLKIKKAKTNVAKNRPKKK